MNPYDDSNAPPTAPSPHVAAPAATRQGVPMWGVLVLCGVLFSAGALAGGVVGYTIGTFGWFFTPYSSYSSTSLVISHDAPASVNVGEQFEVNVEVFNAGTGVETLETLDFHDHVVEAFQLVSMQPSAIASSVDFGWAEYTFNTPIQPGQSITIVVTLEALRPGSFSGAIESWDSNFDVASADVWIDVIQSQQ